MFSGFFLVVEQEVAVGCEGSLMIMNEKIILCEDLLCLYIQKSASIATILFVIRWFVKNTMPLIHHS